MIPKFRAWDKANKKMYKVTSINYALGYVTGYNGGQKRLFFKDCKLMQSTGLKDKNGKEIFEGDIVENTTQIVYLGQRFEVAHNENRACFQLMNNGFTSNIPLIKDSMSYIVIGNIYENKELLEG